MIRVLLVHDHDLTRESLRSVLDDATGIEVVSQATDALEAVKEVGRHEPDVIVMDAAAPGMDDFDAIKRRCPHHAQIRIVILTRLPRPRAAERLLRTSARGFVVGRSAPAELVKAIQTVHGGKRYVSPGLKQPLEQARAKEHKIPQSLRRLTKRERHVFRLLAAGRSTREIAEQLCLSRKTVSAHRTRIFAKLSLRNNVDLARFAFEHKLLDL